MRMHKSNWITKLNENLAELKNRAAHELYKIIPV